MPVRELVSYCMEVIIDRFARLTTSSRLTWYGFCMSGNSIRSFAPIKRRGELLIQFRFTLVSFILERLRLLSRLHKANMPTKAKDGRSLVFSCLYFHLLTRIRSYLKYISYNLASSKNCRTHTMMPIRSKLLPGIATRYLSLCECE